MDRTRAAAGLRAQQGNGDALQRERFRLAVRKLRVRTCMDSTFLTNGPLVQESIVDQESDPVPLMASSHLSLHSFKSPWT